MFCGCSTAYDGAPPNTHVCPVCLGLPGALPTINRRAVEHVLTTGAAIEATAPAGHPLGSQELLLPGPAQGLPDQPVRPAARVDGPADLRDHGWPVHGGDHARASRGGHGQARPRHRRRRAQGQPGRLQPVGRTAHGDRDRAGHPHRRAGPPLRRGAAAAACARSVRRTRTWSAARCGSRPTCRLRVRGAERVRDPGRGQEHELVPGGGAGDRLRDRTPGRGARRGRAARPGDARLVGGARRDLPDAGQGDLGRLSLLPRARPAAAAPRRGVARRGAGRPCPSCPRRGGPATAS